jgi:hypothetical protein
MMSVTVCYSPGVPNTAISKPLPNLHPDMLKQYIIRQLPYALEHFHRYYICVLLLRQTNIIAICTWTRSEILEMQFASEHGQKRDQRLAGSHAQMSPINVRLFYRERPAIPALYQILLTERADRVLACVTPVAGGKAAPEACWEETERALLHPVPCCAGCPNVQCECRPPCIKGPASPSVR